MRFSFTRLWQRLLPPAPLGARGEARAARYLRRKGYRILMRNYDIGSAEVDLIALDGDTLVFVEVKTRQSEEINSPEAQVDRRKQLQLTRAAKRYLANYRQTPPARFDVVAIVWPEGSPPQVRHYIAAFEALF